MDEDNGVFIDPKKVKAVHFEGKTYKTRGPLNVPRSPQTKPVYIAPGGSAARAYQFSGQATPRWCWRADRAWRPDERLSRTR